RADWAAADGRVLTTLARLVRSQFPAVRGGALEVLRDVLAGRAVPNDPKPLESPAEAVREGLESGQAVTRGRGPAVDALGHLLALKVEAAWARDLLAAQVTTAKSHAERAAAVEALSRVANPQAAAVVLDALDKLALDEAAARESAYARAALRADAAG